MTVRAAVVVIVLVAGSVFSEGRGCASCGSSWEDRVAVGLRVAATSSSVSDVRYSAAEFNGHIPLLKSNRLELGASFAFYQDKKLLPPVNHSPGTYTDIVTEYSAFASWLWVRNICGGFNRFIGPSAGVIMRRWPNWEVDNRSPGAVTDWNPRGWVNNGLVMEKDRHAGVGAHFGLEYKFKAPISISIDARPMVMASIPSPELEFFGWGWGYRVKYVF